MSIKKLSKLLLIIPSPFFFHFFETQFFNNGRILPITWFLLVFLGYVFVSGAMAAFLSSREILHYTIAMITISVVLGIFFITAPNDSWFNPLTKELVIILSGVIVSGGQLLVRQIVIKIIGRKVNKLT